MEIHRLEKKVESKKNMIKYVSCINFIGILTEHQLSWEERNEYVDIESH